MYMCWLTVCRLIFFIWIWTGEIVWLWPASASVLSCLEPFASQRRGNTQRGKKRRANAVRVLLKHTCMLYCQVAAVVVCLRKKLDNCSLKSRISAWRVSEEAKVHQHLVKQSRCRRLLLHARSVHGNFAVTTFPSYSAFARTYMHSDICLIISTGKAGNLSQG